MFFFFVFTFSSSFLRHRCHQKQQLYDIIYLLVILILFMIGAIGVFYGNKTSSQFVNFSSTVHMPGDLNNHILLRW